MNNGVRVLYRENGIIIDILFIECLVSYLLLALAVPLWVCSFLAGHIHFQYQLQWIEDPVCVCVCVCLCMCVSVCIPEVTMTELPA